ncbi:unnamed protein product, partial [Closterium sp. NIES-65]
MPRALAADDGLPEVEVAANRAEVQDLAKFAVAENNKRKVEHHTQALTPAHSSSSLSPLPFSLLSLSPPLPLSPSTSLPLPLSPSPYAMGITGNKPPVRVCVFSISNHSASALSFAPFPAALYRCPSFRPAPSAPLPLGQLQRCPSALPPFRHSALPSFRSSSFPPFCLSALPHFRPSALSYLTPSPPPLRAGLRVRAEQGRRAGETEQRSAAGEEESRNELRLMSVAPMPVAALAAGRLKGKRGEGGREGGAEKGRGERGSAGGGSGEGGRGGGWGGGEGGRVGGGEWGKWEACSCHQISCLPSLSPPSIFPPFPPRPPTLPLPFSSSPPLSPSLSPPLSSFPLSISPLPNRPADALRELLEPYGELVRSWNLPDWLIHWGHPGNMAVVLLAMGGYGSYLGWQIRLASSPEAKAAARAAHPPIMGFMFLFFAIGATGGLTSLVTTGRPIFESPHAYSGMAGLVLLTIQTAMTALFK